MTKTERVCLRLADCLQMLAHEIYYLDAATDDEIKMAVLSILGDLYNTFDSKIPAGTAVPYRRE